jgi:hypothetical protein
MVDLAARSQRDRDVYKLAVRWVLGCCGGISGRVLNRRDLVPAMDDLSYGLAALADRIRNDCVVPVTMPRVIGGVENAGKHAPVSQSDAHGLAEIGFNLLIGHAVEIA